MASGDSNAETTVTDHYSVTVPSPVSDRLEIEPGDKIQWTVSADGELRVEVLTQEWGVFEDFEPVDIGETDAVSDHDIGAADYPP